MVPGARHNIRSNSREENVAGKYTHILAIRFSAMGDVAMMVPVLRAVTATYPYLKITVLTRGFFTPIFKNIPNVEVYEADLKGLHTGVIGLGTLAKELRNLEIDAVGDLHDVLRSNVLKSVFYFYGIPVKQIDKGRAEKKALTAERKNRFKKLKSTHQRYADVFANLGYPVDLNKNRFPDKQKLSPGVQEMIGQDHNKLLGIAPFAQHDSKVYPLHLMEEVIDKLAGKGGLKILLFGGGPSETKILEELSSKHENILNVAGKLKFEEELVLISNLDAMLSMDSGNAHLAAMYGIPVITLWGVTHPYAGFAAFNQPWENNLLPDLEKYPKIPTSIYGNKYPEGYEDVMSSISPAEVVKKVEEILQS